MSQQIQTEYYYQFSDHFFRTMVELGIVLEENDNSQESFSKQETDQVEEKTDSVKSASNNDSTKDIKVNEDDDPGSIESVPFISEPAKKKTGKTKKEIS